MERLASRLPATALLQRHTRALPHVRHVLQCCCKSVSTGASQSHPQRSVHRQRKEFLNLEPALRAFHERHKHLAVPLRFTIPALEPPDHHHHQQQQSRNDASTWPEELQGMKLGTALSRFVKVAQKPENAEIAAKLAALGVPVDSVADWKRHLWKQVAVVALRTYHAMHGHFFVPYSFTVSPGNMGDPSAGSQWPRQTWGYKLGYWVVELRRDPSRLESYQLDDLKAMNFVWNAREARWNQYFVPAMKRYEELYGKNASVPQSFVVPHGDGAWPKALQGYRLGQKVNNLRCGDKAGTTTGSAAAAEEMEWDDVELVYSNWMLLDILHEDAEGDKKASSVDAEAKAVAE